MARFRCTPTSKAYQKPTPSGSGHPELAKNAWVLEDEGSVDGDIVRIDITDPPVPQPFHDIAYYEASVSDRGGVETTKHLLGGPAFNWVRRRQCDTALNTQKVRIRYVERARNELRLHYYNKFLWDSLATGYTPVPGDTVTQGAITANVMAASDEGGGNFYVFFDKESDPLINGQSTDINGNTGTQISDMLGRYEPVVGDAFTFTDDDLGNYGTGEFPTYSVATGTMLARTVAGGAGDDYIAMENLAGSDIPLKTDECLIGVTGAGTTAAIEYYRQDAWSTGPAKAANRIELVSEWSAPKFITPVAGTPSVIVTATDTTIVQGEAVILDVEERGFQAERPTHDCHHRFHCDEAGEQRPYSFLPAKWETQFGVAQNQQVEGYCDTWAFAPRTTGMVPVNATVRDQDGNVATGTLNLTVLEPVGASGAFDDTEVYAVSSTGRVVPGVVSMANVNEYTTLAAALAAIPSTGQALLLLDSDDLHEPGVYTQMNFDGLVPDRIAIMSYDAGGIGVNATNIAEVNRGFEGNNDRAILCGVWFNGPYRQTEPWGIATLPHNGIDPNAIRRMSINRCRVWGWETNLRIPEEPGSSLALVDHDNQHWQNFGIHTGAATHHAISGGYLFQDPKCWRGSESKYETTAPFCADHGPLRTSQPHGNRGYSKLHMHCASSWGNVWEDAEETIPKGAITQPVIKWHGVGRNQEVNDFAPIKETASEMILSGITSMAIDPQSNSSGNSACEPKDIRITKTVHVPNRQPGSSWFIGFGGVTLENVMTVVGPEIPYTGDITSQGYGKHVSLSTWSGTQPQQADNENNPVQVRCATFVDLRTEGTQSSQGAAVLVIEGYELGIATIENYVAFAPNFTTTPAGHDGDAANYDTTGRFLYDYEGEYFLKASHGTAAIPPQVVVSMPKDIACSATFEPNSGAPGYQTATGIVPYDDFLSRVRPANASKGAMDPGGT